MKKIFLALTAILFIATASISQAKKSEKAPAAKSAEVKKVEPAAAVKPSAGPTKKDGTPDMRYKENKAAAKPATGPTKKDGTPDLRYKANKEAPKKKG